MFSANTSQVSNDVKYIEDFFSAWLRTGTGSSQTVTTGIKENTGALVISKSRSAATDWAWYDTFRGATKDLASNTSAAETTQSQGLTAFNTDGHTWGTLAKVNTSGATYVDFVLKPTPKFFDVVTYTGNGTSQNIPHNLQSVPGFILIKATSTTSDWFVLARYDSSGGNTSYRNLRLNTTAASVSNSIVVDSSVLASFPTGVFNGAVNTNGVSYVAYFFAHNAGGFGLTGTDNVISCGSFTTDASGNATVNLGYEPQLCIVKAASTTSQWHIMDSMRGFGYSGTQVLYPNLSNAEATGYSTNGFVPTATGFQVNGQLSAGQTYIYIAIRRGPMKTPTSGTSVFQPRADASAPGIITDFVININRAGGVSWSPSIGDRLRGSPELTSSSTAAEAAAGYAWASMTGLSSTVTTGRAYEYFRRAPGFFDEVCYTGTGVARTINHNLGVAPELMIVKGRTGPAATLGWQVYFGQADRYLVLNSNAAQVTGNTDRWNSTQPTASVFSLGTAIAVNDTSSNTYVAYLFASCPGVSKVGSYTGTGTTQQINCGFAAGARFVLIKRTDSTGDWYVWDSARGIVAGNDPYLLLNSTAAEVTTTDYVDTFSSGFEISSTAPAAINASGGTFIYLAIA